MSSATTPAQRRTSLQANPRSPILSSSPLVNEQPTTRSNIYPLVSPKASHTMQSLRSAVARSSTGSSSVLSRQALSQPQRRWQSAESVRSLKKSPGSRFFFGHVNSRLTNDGPLNPRTERRRSRQLVCHRQAHRLRHRSLVRWIWWAGFPVSPSLSIPCAEHLGLFLVVQQMISPKSAGTEKPTPGSTTQNYPRPIKDDHDQHPGGGCV